MLDMVLIREKPDWVKERLALLNDPPALARIDAILALDRQRRALLSEAEALQAQRNRLNRGVGRLRGDKRLDDARRAALAQRAAGLIAAGEYEAAAQTLETQPEAPAAPDAAAAVDALSGALRTLGERVEALNAQVSAVDAQLEDNMLWVPNLPHASVPVAPGEEGNIAWPPEGAFYEFAFEPLAHWDLGPALGIIDFERGVKLAGTRSYVLVGAGARLQRALIQFFLDQARRKGFVEVYLPLMVPAEMMTGAGQFPKFRDNVYTDPDAGIYMLPTAEVAITNLHRDEILDEAQLPLYYVGHTPCFRRERMSAGRDVRGIKRVHQFEKVEMYKFTTPDSSYAELETLAEAAADLCRALRIPFRRLEIVTGDLGFSASKKYDIEMYAPGCREWLEVSSCSNTEAFQARRANVKYRPAGDGRAQFVHTLNGSGLATPRVLIAILENYQQADGSVVVPEALRPYMDGLDVIRGA